MFNEAMNFCQISNLLGVFPILLAVQFGIYDLAIAMTFATCLSIIYHYDETNEMALWADIGGCCIVMAFLLQILMNTDKTISFAHLLTMVYSIMAIGFYIMAGDTGTEQYHYFHTGWHVCMFYATSLFMYTHIHSTVQKGVSKSVITKPIWPSISRGIRRIRAIRPSGFTFGRDTHLSIPTTGPSESGGRTELVGDGPGNDRLDDGISYGIAGGCVVHSSAHPLSSPTKEVGSEYLLPKETSTDWRRRGRSPSPRCVPVKNRVVVGVPSNLAFAQV